MRLEDRLLFAIDEAVAINEVGYDEYYENVNSLIMTQLHINEAYINNEINYSEFNQLMLEYSRNEMINIAGRKVKRMGAEYLVNIRDEFEKTVNSWKKRGFVNRASAVCRVTGITISAGARVGGALAVGPIDWALNGAAALITLPVKDYDIPLTTPLYKTTTKPFIDEIKNRHAKKCEGIVDTAKGLKERALVLRKKSENGELNPTQIESQVNKLMKDILSLAKSIDKEHEAIQKDIDKTAVKMERISKSRSGYTDGSNEYHRLKHKMDDLKQLHDKLSAVPKDKYDSKSKPKIRDMLNDGRTETIMTKYANKYRIKEQMNGRYKKSDCQTILRQMVKDSAPDADIKAVKSYIQSL